jgi:AcrR family transcriptional regulator
MITDGNHAHTTEAPAAAPLDAPASTRDRLLDAALALFAERGFQGTTVGDIESAAGLSPRSGGLYKHFGSKEEVLRAAVERHARDVGQVQQMMSVMPLGDLRAELTLLVRLGFQELERERELIRVLFREGDRFPDLRDEMHERVVRQGHRLTAGWIRWKVEQGDFPPGDTDALAAVAVSAIVGYRMEEILFGRQTGDVEEERLVQALVDACLALTREAPDRRGQT